ncbi:hypothetical protein GOBAR_DD00519 [Gossypium barbadense]|nr:hypothetical protein GOBAR_DD00519 [Gossypium barbadense]
METLEGGCSEAGRSEDRSIKKVCFKEIDGDLDVVMVVDLDQVPSLSWKERLMGKMPRVVGRELEAIDFDEEKDFVLIEGNVMRSFINASEAYGSLMLVERRSRRNLNVARKNDIEFLERVVVNSRFEALETLMEKYGYQWERSWLEVVLGHNGARPLKGTKTFESERVAKKIGQVNDMSQGNHAGEEGPKGNLRKGREELIWLGIGQFQKVKEITQSRETWGDKLLPGPNGADPSPNVGTVEVHKEDRVAKFSSWSVEGETTATFHHMLRIEGFMEVLVALKERFLGTKKYSIVVFKENVHPNPLEIAISGQKENVGVRNVTTSMHFCWGRIGFVFS